MWVLKKVGTTRWIWKTDFGPILTRFWTDFSPISVQFFQISRQYITKLLPYHSLINWIIMRLLPSWPRNKKIRPLLISVGPDKNFYHNLLATLVGHDKIFYQTLLRSERGLIFLFLGRSGANVTLFSIQSHQFVDKKGNPIYSVYTTVQFQQWWHLPWGRQESFLNTYRKAAPWNYVLFFLLVFKCYCQIITQITSRLHVHACVSLGEALEHC